MKLIHIVLSLIFGLLFVPASAYQTQRIAVPSLVMGTSPNSTVILPDRYSSGDGRFPTIYLLHGWSGNDTDWSTQTTVGHLADQYNLIIVMPDGGYDKWYIDSPVSPKNKYETYVGKEVVDYIDHHYRTIATRDARAITGLSMGGFGALNIAINNATDFGAAGSISGGVDPRAFPTKWGLENVFGDPVGNADYWNSKALINNANRFAGIDLAIECGVDDFFIDSNRALHQRLVELKVPHDYTERPGGHTWDYWSNAIKYQVLFFSDKFQEKLK